MVPSKELLRRNGRIDDPEPLTRQSDKLDPDSFREWYKAQEFERNIRNGQHYFNGPGKIKQARRQSPNQLLQCRRKTIYKQQQAPVESPDPHGIFWVGSQIEEELALQFLADHVADENEYITNSLWVDFIVQTDTGKIRVKGSTDPVIVDENATPILPFEIKTKRSIENLESPNRHHRAQTTAYLYGLSEKYDREIDTGVILYISRETFQIKPFTVEFDDWFWTNNVLPWIADITAYRLEDELPPAKPEYEWECNHCQYRERCGNGEREFHDSQPTGLLPLFEYPKSKVKDYLSIFDDENLTPTLAHLYPDLAEEFGVEDWECRGCDSTFHWKNFRPSGQSPPKCPNCTDKGSIRFLSGPRAHENEVFCE